MTRTDNQKTIESIAASVEMEGFIVKPEYKILCAKMLNKEITMNEYIGAIKSLQGIDTEWVTALKD